MSDDEGLTGWQLLLRAAIIAAVGLLLVSIADPEDMRLDRPEVYATPPCKDARGTDILFCITPDSQK